MCVFTSDVYLKVERPSRGLSMRSKFKFPSLPQMSDQYQVFNIPANEEK